MSTSLYWSLIPEEPKDHDIDYLKYAIAKHIWDSDGSLGESAINVGTGLISFLEGIIAVGDKEMARDAKQLIHDIEKHGEVHIFIHG